MKIKIIIPVYPGAFINADFRFPEAHKTPARQVEWLREFARDEKVAEKDEIVVITTSPYIAEGLCKVKGVGHVSFSDGRNDLTSEQFFRHFAEPMRGMSELETAFDTKNNK